MLVKKSGSNFMPMPAGNGKPITHRLVDRTTDTGIVGGLVAGDRLGCADRFDELGDGLFGKVAGDVGFADYAQQPMIFDDGQPADLVFSITLSICSMLAAAPT